MRCVGELEEEPVDPPAIYAFSMENNGSPPPPSSSYSSSSWLPSLRGGDENPVHRRDGGGDGCPLHLVSRLLQLICPAAVSSNLDCQSTPPAPPLPPPAFLPPSPSLLSPPPWTLVTFRARTFLGAGLALLSIANKAPPPPQTLTPSHRGILGSRGTCMPTSLWTYTSPWTPILPCVPTSHVARTYRSTS